jgi:nucleoside 2-deoxyribosyltransferase
MTTGANNSIDRTPGAGVYLAGPSGFFEAGLLWHNTVLVPKVKQAGLFPFDPWADQSAITTIQDTMEFGADRRSALHSANLRQGRYDLEMIDRSTAILASLDGVDVDSGTALEIGYGFGRGLLIVGLRTDVRLSGDNEGSSVNLMIETCIADSGGILTRSLDEAVDYLAQRLVS